MPGNYLDTSLLVAAFTLEDETDRVQSWIAARDSGSFLISDWTITEFSSALSVKIRRRMLSILDHADALRAFGRAFGGENILAVRQAHFHTAARIADQHGLGLRAGDALHLAIASDHGATLWTLDQRLAKEAPALGMAVRIV